jgi:hypothetical protein
MLKTTRLANGARISDIKTFADRERLRRVITSLVEPKGDGQTCQQEGCYSDRVILPTEYP